jgi:acyl-CoA thioesterase
MSEGNLALDTKAVAEGNGRYSITMPGHWDYLLPSGGVIMTATLRAAEAEIADPRYRFGSATSIFASPMNPGKLVADVHVIRRGKSAVQCRVTMKHAEHPKDADADENAGLETIATFIRDRKGPDVIGTTMPKVRALADSIRVEDDSPSNPHARFRFYHQLECRIADGEKFWTANDGTPPFTAGPARYARWFRYRQPQRDADGQLDRLALPPIIDTMPTALHRAIGPGDYRFYAPSLDLTTYVIGDTKREWLLVATSVRRVNQGWGIGEVEVWDDEGQYVAYGAQAMYLHGVAGEPPTVDASMR